MQGLVNRGSENLMLNFIAISCSPPAARTMERLVRTELSPDLTFVRVLRARDRTPFFEIYEREGAFFLGIVQFRGIVSTQTG